MNKGIGTPNNWSTSFLNCTELAVDIETRDPSLKELGPSIWRGGGHIAGVALATGTLNSYFDLQHPDSRPEMIESNIRFLRDVLARPSVKIGAEITYDLLWLNHESGKVAGKFRDVQYAEALIDEYRPSYSLEALCRIYQEPAKGTRDLSDFCREQGWPDKEPAAYIWRMPAAVVGEYASWDAQAAYNIYQKQKRLLAEQELDAVYEMECDLIPLLMRMRQVGVRVDEAKLIENRKKTAEKVEKLSHELENTLGGINIGSTQQLAHRFESMGIPVPRKPPTDNMIARGITKGNPSLDAAALKILAVKHPICAKILDFRHNTTLLSMFFDSYPKFMVDGRIRCQFHPLRNDSYGTVSGRFSSSCPNLQQVSGASDDTESGSTSKSKLVRDLFIPEDGKLWAKLDYSQVEYRLQAHYACSKTGDGSASRIRKAYNDDPHTDFHKRVMDETGLDRKKAKNLNFGASYGMGIEACSKNFGWSEAQAQLFTETYHNKFPFIKTTRGKVVDKATARGYIKTVLGRRSRTHTSRALHSMYNRLIQGSAADLMKKGMVKAWEAGLFEVLIPHLTVHDEIDVSFDAGNTEHVEALKYLKHTMEKAIPCRVPIICDVEVGSSWGSVEEYNF